MSGMSKKHFIAIAKAFRPNVELAQHEGKTRTVDALRNVAEGLAVTFTQFNPEFRRQTFMDACGFDVKPQTYAEKVPAQMHGAPLRDTP